MKLTIFDLDNTLLAGDSDHTWGQFVVRKGLVDAESFSRQNDDFYRQYEQRTLDMHAYQRFVLTPLISLSPEARADLHREFMATLIQPMRLPKAEALIAEHKAAGDRLLIITATNAYVAGPIGPLIGIETVLATEPEAVNGQFTGAILGVPCYQQGKIQRLEAWLSQQAFTPTSTRFYSDSANDLPLLNYVDHPVAVDPDPTLRAHAEAQCWPIISLRD
ncbi:MAG: HAD-IB family hydrolase [Cellvibrionaceae bacterium]|nr:HAD-IB family hydrolase [Cellvibrionaceae bacterium]